MGITLKNKKISPINISIDFFASIYDLVIVFFAFQYDMVYYFFKFLLKTIVKFVLKIKKIGPINILINIFAFQYDLVYSFFKFLLDYVKWITNTHSIKSSGFVTHNEQLIHVHSQNTYEFR
jgi:hypothetical protein